jgi:hypothetical protein
MYALSPGILAYSPGYLLLSSSKPKKKKKRQKGEGRELERITCHQPSYSILAVRTCEILQGYIEHASIISGF